MEVTRRYDIDWLRVIAIALLLIYHGAIGFQPWGVFIGFIQNSESLESVWTAMSMLNIWRIPFLFFVSGMGVWFAIQRRDWKALLVERSKRILLPFLFGMAAIVPVHTILWFKYYNQDIQYIFNPGHLWFLGNIFVYVIVLLPLFFYFKSKPDGEFKKLLNRIFSHPAGLLILMLPFVLESTLVQPESFELYAMTWHGFFLGSVAFLSGFICVYSGEAFWKTVTKWRWAYLLIAVSIYLIRVNFFDLRTPDFAMSIESCFWIFAVFGFGHRYLNKPSSTLTYLSKAVYPIYIIHMILLYAGSYFLFSLEMSAILKFLLVNAFTLLGSLTVYEFMIRRVALLRPFFGLKSKGSQRVKVVEQQTTSVVLQD